MGTPLSGTGLGLRRAHLGPLLSEIPEQISFLEVSPENWLGVGGRLRDAFESIVANRPLVSHGLSLDLGGLDPIDEGFVRQVDAFLDQYNVLIYGDHLTYCANQGHLYELLPIPFTNAAARHVGDRIKRVQDLMGRRITIENASYYCAPGQELPETEFINSVLEQADCLLLLDVNNVYVNSVNHGYDATLFIDAIDPARVAYIHIAGHEQVENDLIIDTHGEPIIDPVFDLLQLTYEKLGPIPTLLERDENIPPLADSLAELRQISELQENCAPSQPASLLTVAR